MAGRVLVVQFDFAAEEESELSVRAGDKVTLLGEDPDPYGRAREGRADAKSAVAPLRNDAAPRVAWSPRNGRDSDVVAG